MTVVPLPSLRQLVFLGVGGTCFAVQYGLLTALVTFGPGRPLANDTGFVVSAHPKPDYQSAHRVPKAGQRQRRSVPSWSAS